MDLRTGWTIGLYSIGAGGWLGHLLSACLLLRYLREELSKSSLMVSVSFVLLSPITILE